MKELKDTFKVWEDVSDILAHRFTQRYFGKDIEYYWIADEIGGTIEVVDYYFSLDDMIQFTRHKYTKNQMFEYYEYARAMQLQDETPINIRNWKLIK